MFNRSLLGAMALLLVTSTLAQTVADPPTGTGGTGTGGTGSSGSGTGGTGTGGTGSGGSTGGSGATSWPYGQWVLQTFAPNATVRFWNPTNGSTFGSWPYERDGYSTYFYYAHSTPSLLQVNASPTATLRWQGIANMFPEQVHIRLKPTTTAAIYSIGDSLLQADVGRLTETRLNGLGGRQELAYGPLYKTVTPSNSLLQIPAINLLALASSDHPQNNLVITAEYKWEVLPPLLIKTHSLDGVEPKNFRRNAQGVREENTRDRNGKQNLDAAMIFMGETGGWYKYRGFESSYSSYSRPEFEYTSWGRIAQNGNFVGITIEEPFLISSPGTTIVEASVRDLDDGLAPSIEQETCVNWHFPFENYKELSTELRIIAYEAEPDGNKQFVAGMEDTAHGRVHFAPLHFWDTDWFRGKLVPMLKDALTSFAPWGKLGKLVQIFGLVTPDSLELKTHPVSPGFIEQWTDDESYFDGVRRGDMDNPPVLAEEGGRYEMRPGAWIRWKFSHFDSEAYDSNGYTGQHQHKYAKAEWVERMGYYTQVIDP